MTVTYDQEIWTAQRVIAKGDTEQEWELVKSHLQGLGYTWKEPVLGEPWEVWFTHTKIVANSNRGDKIALDGRYELKGGE